MSIPPTNLEDARWLVGDDAAGWLDEAAGWTDRGPQVVERLRRSLSVERARLVAEQVELRRRATAKFASADRMFFTRVGLAQATDDVVAGYKAERFAVMGGRPIADLCCGIGGDLTALHRIGEAVGVDRDPVAAVFAEANSGTCVTVAAAEQIDVAEYAAWHADPDRRSDDQRTTRLECYSPNLDALEKLLSRREPAAIKLAPATVVPAGWQKRGELEWIGHGRECKQQIAWFGKLAVCPGQRSATVVKRGLRPRRIAGLPDLPMDVARKLSRWIIVPDPAVIAARLVGALAVGNKLSAVAAGSAWLTGDEPLSDAPAVAFEVYTVLPLEERGLRQALRAGGFGPVEVKVRDVSINPADWQARLSAVEGTLATVLIGRFPHGIGAVIGRRLPSSPE